MISDFLRKAWALIMPPMAGYRPSWSLDDYEADFRQQRDAAKETILKIFQPVDFDPEHLMDIVLEPVRKTGYPLERREAYGRFATELFDHDSVAFFTGPQPNIFRTLCQSVMFVGFGSVYNDIFRRILNGQDSLSSDVGIVSKTKNIKFGETVYFGDLLEIKVIDEGEDARFLKTEWQGERSQLDEWALLADLEQDIRRNFAQALEAHQEHLSKVFKFFPILFEAMEHPGFSSEFFRKFLTDNAGCSQEQVDLIVEKVKAFVPAFIDSAVDNKIAHGIQFSEDDHWPGGYRVDYPEDYAVLYLKPDGEIIPYASFFSASLAFYVVYRLSVDDRFDPSLQAKPAYDHSYGMK